MSQLSINSNNIFEINFKRQNIASNNYVLNKNLTTPQDKFEKQDNPQNTSVAKKIFLGIGLGIVALLVAAKLIQQHRIKELAKIPEELKVIFEELKGKDGNDFINLAYKKLKVYMKLDGIAPEIVGYSGKEKGKTIIGGHNVLENTIKYTDGFFDNKYSKKKQIGLLAHELVHAKQAEKVIRAGMLEEYADAIAYNTLEQHKAEPLLDMMFTIAYKDAKKVGKEKEFLEQQQKLIKQNYLDKIKQTHESTLKLPKYKVNAPEIEEAKKIVEARKVYKPFDDNPLADNKEYYENYMEKEAYAYQRQLQKWYKSYARWA